VNKELGLPLTIGLMGELVDNNELGRKVADEGFEGPALDPFTRAKWQVTGFPVFVAGSVGGIAVEVGNAAMLGKWMLQMMWRVSVVKPVTGSLKR
jgi:hypothetical protein